MSQKSSTGRSSRSRSRDRDSREKSVESDNFESIPLDKSTSPRTSGRVRRTIQQYQPESVSPRSSRVTRKTQQYQPESHPTSRIRGTTQKYQPESVSPRSTSQPAPKSSMEMSLSESHNNDEKDLKASSIINKHEAEKYKMIFTIGRMNPPTSGHMGLISVLMGLARKNNLDNIGIVLSPSEDNKNPLSCDRKKEYIMEMISNISNMSNIRPNIICKETGFPMSNIGELLKISGLDNNSKMLLIIGEDRANAFNWLKNYFPNLVIDALDRPEGAMSATKIRGFVSAENENAFNQAYAGILQPNRIEDLYNDISSGLANYDKTTSTSTKKSTKKSQKRGGRKTKSKSKKSKKRRTIRR
uniref:Cytidyltransferase-like domain-containing protein n=1 Tax=viral metagenome TaxID=1070528 RepID=A0A6C0E3S4_9ZZZZ